MGTVSDTAASVDVTAPAGAPAGGWASYALRVCTAAGGCTDPVSCTAVAAATSGTTTCDLAGLLPYTIYTVKAEAVGGATRSRAGSLELRTRIS